MSKHLFVGDVSVFFDGEDGAVVWVPVEGVGLCTVRITDEGVMSDVRIDDGQDGLPTSVEVTELVRHYAYSYWHHEVSLVHAIGGGEPLLRAVH